MCGFVGLIDPSLSPGARESLVRRMTATVAHRGPDASGIFVDSAVSLGHCRLSILDLSPTGAQPMSLGRNMPTISFNGEVYNFLDLRRELVARGRAFRGGSDTEVVLNAYAEWGLSGLKRLEGIFAFALWDPISKRLILMRDRFGVKPLFFAAAGNRIVFGSEIKALLAAGGLDKSVDEQSFAEYLWYGNSYEDRTIYRGVKSLLPGHWMLVEEGKCRIEPWWRVEEWIHPNVFVGDEADAAKAVQEALDVAVKRQMVADVPVSLFLSGGIDSSAIAAASMRVQAAPLKSYTVYFDSDQGDNELSMAREVANHLHLDHHEVRVDGRDLGNVLQALVSSHDEPFADAANIPLRLLAMQFRSEGKVVLQGDGGDEMFAGYRQYSFLKFAKYLRMWPKGLTFTAPCGFGNSWTRFSRVVDAVGASDPAMQMALLLTIETLRRPPTEMLRPEVRAHLAANTDPFLGYRRCAARFEGSDPLQKMLLTDLALQLPSQFLPKVDRATMSAGVEARVPFLDENVARLSINLPMKWKVQGSRRKVVLRNALRGRIPDRILDAPKTGFGVPYERWLRTSLFELARSVVLEDTFISRFGFEKTKLESAFSNLKKTPGKRGFTMWKVFQLALWANQNR